MVDVTKIAEEFKMVNENLNSPRTILNELKGLVDISDFKIKNNNLIINVFKSDALVGILKEFPNLFDKWSFTVSNYNQTGKIKLKPKMVINLDNFKSRVISIQCTNTS